MPQIFWVCHGTRARAGTILRPDPLAFPVRMTAILLVIGAVAGCSNPVKLQPLPVVYGPQRVQLCPIVPESRRTSELQVFYATNRSASGPADDRLWRRSFRLGGAGSPWIGLLNYVCQCVTHMPEAVQDGPLGRHLEEMIGVHLLTQWRAHLDRPVVQNEYRLAPRHVLAAERHIREHARHAPTLGELAAVAGVSVRSLSQAFREYRGCTPMEALREQRLQGVRAELLLAQPGATVRSVAADWGFAHFGHFARLFRQRFGELPEPRSTTLRRYGTDGTTIERFAPDSIVITDNGGADSLTLSDPDFNVLSFRSNLVLRWEWRPGSTLFLVWQQNRGSEVTSNHRVTLDDMWDSFGTEGDNFFALKITYWLGIG